MAYSSINNVFVLFSRLLLKTINYFHTFETVFASFCLENSVSKTTLNSNPELP